MGWSLSAKSTGGSIGGWGEVALCPMCLALVARDLWVDFCRPCVDPSAQRLHILKALVSQPCGDVEGSLSVVAKDGEVFFRIQFLVSPGRHVAHGHKGAGFDVGGGVLPWLTDVDETRLVFAEQGGCVDRGYLVFEHVFSVSVQPDSPIAPKRSDPSNSWRALNEFAYRRPAGGAILGAHVHHHRAAGKRGRRTS